MKRKDAFTLIDVLTGTFIVLIFFLGIVGAYRLGLKAVWQSKARITATALANQKLEAARSMAYNDVGTAGGAPSGIIAQTETLDRNNINYAVRTTIVYVDDPFDGLVPEDEFPSDYKRMKVLVSWVGQFSGEVVLMTDISPKNTEEGGAGRGSIKITVLNSSGQGVDQADIHITNSEISPLMDARYKTDFNGDLLLPGVLQSEENYKITVAKTGYSQDRTYGRDELDSPGKPHASVYDGQLTEISFSIDKLSSMTVQTRDSRSQGNPPLHGVTFNIRGAKTIGQNDGLPVYKYNQNHTTNGPAQVVVSDLEWDSYFFSVDGETTGLELIEVESPAGSATAQPVDLLPDAEKEVRLLLSSENTLLATVLDEETSQPIFGASVNLRSDQLEFDQTQPTGEDGKAFFSPLARATYRLTVEAIEHESHTENILVSGGTEIVVNLEE